MRPIAVRPVILPSSRRKCSAPLLRARVVKWRGRAGVRVDAGKVRPLEQIAVVAGEREVAALIQATVLARDDVLDVVGKERLPRFRHAAVFAATAGALANHPPIRSRNRHYAAVRNFRRAFD